MPTNLSASQSSDHVGGLAAALQACKLRKTSTTTKANESAGSSSNSSSGYGSIGHAKGGGMASMMDEMQKTLARRRAKVDQADPDSGDKDDSKVRLDFIVLAPGFS